MISKMIIKFLTGKLLKKIASKVVIDVLAHLAKESDNKLDDIMVASIREALK